MVLTLRLLCLHAMLHSLHLLNLYVLLHRLLIVSAVHRQPPSPA
jgi:hypothetical protein